MSTRGPVSGSAPGTSSRRIPVGVRILLAVAGVALLVVALWQESRSVERANRLLHSGELPAAIEGYERAMGRGADSLRVLYNLGTVLLPTDPGRAEALLIRVTESETPTAQPGHYNLGVRALLAAERAEDPDSTRVLLFESVRHGRVALRLDSTDEDARWNLALAERRLGEIFAGMDDTARSDAEIDDDAFVVDDPSLTRSEEADGVSGREPEQPRAAERIGERSGARDGAQEAWATQDPGPISAGDALGFLDQNSDDPETLIRGILWSHRPDIAWWESQPYPGGDW